MVGGGDFTVARYNLNGGLDTSFDSDGKVVTDIALRNDHGLSVGLQFNGKIIVVGYSENATDYDFAVNRYNADGSPDTGFSGDGIVTTAIGATFDQAHGMAMQTDGKFVVAGYAHNGTDYDYAVVRYFGDDKFDHFLLLVFK